MISVEHFKTRFAVDPETRCWGWLGHLSPGGYGQYGRRGRPAHRVAYELFVGPIPEGLEIDHLCRNRRCVNPEHLEAVTPAENNRRSSSPTALNALKTHCDKGHEFTPENTGRARPSGRYCRTCERARLRARRLEKKAA